MLFLFGAMMAALLAQGPSGADPNAGTVWVNVPKAGTLPAGVTHHVYRSASMGHDVGFLIYLPPQYASEPERRFPVIYNLHGAGGNELHGQLAAEILHEGIVAKRWPPMILAMPNGGKYTFYKDSANGKYMGETTIVRELIPHVDRTFRTIAGREGRAIEGFSMGGRGATRLAMKYPDLFCSLFNQAGNVYHTSEQYDPSKPDVYPNNYLGKDRQRYVENDTFLLLQANVEKIRNRMRIQIACGTKDDGHLKTVREFHQALLNADVDHTYLEIESLAHEQSKMLQLYRPVWFDYHAESFRRAQSTVWSFDNIGKIGGYKTEVLGAPKVVDTELGKAIWFDGQDDAIYVPKHPLAGAAAFTWEAIFRPDGGAFEQRWFHLAEQADGVDTGNRMLFEIRVTNGNWYLDSFAATKTGAKALLNKEHLHPVGSWYHVASVYDGRTFRNYVNGKLEGSGDVAFSPMGDGRSSIGVRINKVNYFRGAVLRARFTKRALRPEEFWAAPGR
ncbi:MAG: hypothetical protein JNK48_29060 [Bryobacterales bacterium]|nr:hypothetical protein [Bryobacterales bacterium]